MVMSSWQVELSACLEAGLGPDAPLLSLLLRRILAQATSVPAAGGHSPADGHRGIPAPTNPHQVALCNCLGTRVGCVQTKYAVSVLVGEWLEVLCKTC